MKRLFCVLMVFCAALSSHAQNDPETKIQFEISRSSMDGQLDMAILQGVRGFIEAYLTENGYVLRPDKETSEILEELEEYDEFNANYAPGMYNPVIGGIYTLGYKYTSEGRYCFVLTHTSRTGDTRQRQSKSYPIEWLKFEDAQKLVAYELIDESFGLTDQGKSVLKDLFRKKDDFFKGISEGESDYTFRSFLPPVNQFAAHNAKGTSSGIIIMAGYGISVGSFLWSTASYKANKRKLEGVSVDLTEAEKAREHYRKQMAVCRGGQIASAALFAGTYIFGVVNALSNRALYQNKSKDRSFAPVAYDNGAGVALVYRF